MENVIVKATAILPNIVRLVTHGDLSMDDVRSVNRKLQYVINEFDNYFIIEYDAV